MDSPSPAPVQSPSDQDRPLLPCIQFMNAHFRLGGMEKKAYDILYKMIEMMSAIGYEAGVIFSSTNTPPSSIARIECYLGHIQEGTDAFTVTMLQTWRRARRAANSLPELHENDDMFQTKWRQWYWKLRTMHEPTGNDANLFRLVKQHLYREMYERLLQLHFAKPRGGYARLAEHARSIHLSLDRLELLASQADAFVQDLDNRYDAACEKIPGGGKDGYISEEAIVSSPELLKPDVYQIPGGLTTVRPDQKYSKSFGIAEEELMRRGHTRASTFTARDCNTSDPQTSFTKRSPDLYSIGVRKRRGITDALRVFTGSFSYLEDEIRRLQIDKVTTPETPIIQGINDPVTVRDFAPTPAGSPCTTPSPITLQRREAMVSRDAEFQDRVVNGEIVKHRRPSNKGRARTLDDSTGGVEAWLRESSSEIQDPDREGLIVVHRHREHTL